MAIDETTWPAKYDIERIKAMFDFTQDLAPGTTVASVSMTVTTVRGTDASPAAILYGAVDLRGARAYQYLSAGVAGCSYKVAATAVTSDQQILVLARVLPVKAI